MKKLNCQYFSRNGFCRIISHRIEECPPSCLLFTPKYGNGSLNFDNIQKDCIYVHPTKIGIICSLHLEDIKTCDGCQEHEVLTDNVQKSMSEKIIDWIWALKMEVNGSSAA